MKTTEDIIAQFDDIPRMPVSEEILGAYFEGNLSDDETFAVESIIADNDDFADFVSDIDVSDPYDIDLGDYTTDYFAGSGADIDLSGYDDYTSRQPDTADLSDTAGMDGMDDTSGASHLADTSYLTDSTDLDVSDDLAGSDDLADFADIF